MTGGDELNAPTTEQVVYEGPCMIYEANNLRSYKQGTAYKEDMGCDIPWSEEMEAVLFSIREGDLLDFNRYGNEGKALLINTAIPSKMGCTYRFNHPKI